MEIRDIPNFSKYQATDEGYIIEKETGVRLNSRQTIKLIDDNGNKRGFNVANIIAKAFIPNPNNFRYVIRKDNNRENNRPDNLMWSLSSRRWTTKTIIDNLRKELDKHIAVNINMILENKDDYTVQVLDEYGKKVKNEFTIDQFRAMFYDDDRMFEDYLKFIMSRKSYANNNEIWRVHKK